MQGEREGNLSSSLNGPLPLFQGKTSQLHVTYPFPLPKENIETDQLYADLLWCCVRRELEGRRSDQKHGGN